ncbi:hypothetical protein [Vitiosangium sp. GDMCC 1.1324]|uniref:hypothetical protein n=1 Tax=Vitiosangium sp. (strain GDMCC 1.1324) TaxID=2138576 RepID=UPI000D39A9B4|nr:hypothetical protein [Vitiosangium sp. GDMCC 1.1324]PTL83918.1 hypothetical protein DAT35_10690 [Vitiosangium sp. GDMCC 1.1324]
MWKAIQKASKSVLAVGIVFSSMAALATEWFDTTAAERAASGYPIAKRGDVTWAYANRSSNEVCKSKGFATGLYVGHQAGELMGVNCFDEDTVDWFDTTLTELRRLPGWGNDTDDNTHVDKQVPFWANYAAFAVCNRHGYGTGFFTGHQSGELVGVHCIARDKMHYVQVPSNDARFGLPGGRPTGWPWHYLNITANDVCAYHGYRTGLLSAMFASGQPFWVWLEYHCFD